MNQRFDMSDAGSGFIIVMMVVVWAHVFAFLYDIGRIAAALERLAAK